MKVNLEKAKEIAHDKRRVVRAEKFAPLDVKATIPSEADQAEADRQVVRDEDAALQIKLSDAATVDELVAEMQAGGLA